MDSLCPELHGQLGPPSGVLQVSVWGWGECQEARDLGVRIRGAHAVLTQQEQQEGRQLGCGLGWSQQEPGAPMYAEDGTRLASKAQVSHCGRQRADEKGTQCPAAALAAWL